MDSELGLLAVAIFVIWCAFCIAICIGVFLTSDND